MNWSILPKIPTQFLATIHGVSFFIKREDLIHPLISGNKFRKLKYNFIDFDSNKYSGILTFGGAFSNHLTATAAAGKKMNIQTHGVIRGEELKNKPLNPSLSFCKENGMKLHFISRENYPLKEHALEIREYVAKMNLKVIPEGGTNELAVKGCAEILDLEDATFDTICVAVGTGGTFLGLSKSIHQGQRLIGFPVVDDRNVIEHIQKNCVTTSEWQLDNSALIGAYGKTSDEIVHFINNFYKNHQILLDPLYTGKLLFGIFALVKSSKWNFGKKVLIIHTGGLQSIEGFNQIQKRKSKPCIYVP